MHLTKFKIYIATIVMSILGFIIFSAHFVDVIHAESPSLDSVSSDSDPESNLDYLFVVFFLTWLAFFGYLLFLSRRLKAMKKEVFLLKEFIKNNKG